MNCLLYRIRLKKAGISVCQNTAGSTGKNAKAQAAAQYESNKKNIIALSGLAIVIIAALLLYRNSKQNKMTP